MNEKGQEWNDFVSRYTSSSHSSRHSSPERELDHGDITLSPISSVFATAEPQFCRRSNIDECIVNLSQELEVLGFSSLFTPTCNGRGPPDTFDIVKLVNITYELLQQQQQNRKQITDLKQNTYELLQQQQRNMKQITDLEQNCYVLSQQQQRNRKQIAALEQENSRVKCDSENLNKTRQRLKEQLERAERRIAMKNEEKRQVEEKLLKAEKQLKLEREELKKTKANSLRFQEQFSRETRKKEQELIKLKEKITELLIDKTQEKKVGLDISRLTNRPAGGQRALWKI